MRRERTTILLETLLALGEAREESLVQTAARCGLPYDRFRRIVDQLVEHGFVAAGPPFRVTGPGCVLAEAYLAWREVLDRHGIVQHTGGAHAR